MFSNIKNRMWSGIILKAPVYYLWLDDVTDDDKRQIEGL